MYLLWWLLIGGIAGWLAGLLVEGHGFGLFGNIIVGIVGALLGGFIFRALGFSNNGLLLTAFVGAVILLFIAGLIRRPTA